MKNEIPEQTLLRYRIMYKATKSLWLKNLIKKKAAKLKENEAKLLNQARKKKKA